MATQWAQWSEKMIEVRTLYDQPQRFHNQEVWLGGWVRTARDNKHIGFIALNDGSCFSNLQIVLNAETLANYSDIIKIGTGASLLVRGTFVLTPDTKQPFEVQADEIILEGDCPADVYPLAKKRHSFEYLRTIAHLRPRTNTFAAVFRTRSLLSFAIHQFFNERGFVYVHTPLITASDAEGAGEMFQVTTLPLDKPPRTDGDTIDFSQDFFGKPSYLTVSGQLNVETYAMAFRNVYTFGPTFRAENSNTTRHAAEFWMVEPEMAFATLAELMTLAEDMLKYIIAYLLEHAPEEMAFFDEFIEQGLIERLKKILQAKFTHITYTQAIEKLISSGQEFAFPVSWGCDLQTEHERYLCETVYNGPVFVTDYPKGIKAFYMRLNDDDKTVAAMDLLVPGVGEIMGGSQREDRLDVLEQRIRDTGMDLEPYRWYLDMRRFGGARHAGFGLGFERALMYVTGIGNIRDVISFPRTVGNAEF